MTTQRPGRLGGAARIASIIAVLCVAAALAGCYRARPESAPAPAQVGQCRDLRLPPDLAAISDATPPGPCAAPHTVETFALSAVTGDYAEWKTRPLPWILRQLTAQICPDLVMRAFLGAGARDSFADTAVHAYFPNESAWRAGDRKVRCDLALQGANSALRRIAVDLRGIMPTPDSATVRTCYQQTAQPDGGWSLDGPRVTCDQPHSSQDINAFLATPADPSAADVAANCGPFAAQFLGADPADQELIATGVVVALSNGTYSLHCAIGGDAAHGRTTGVILPAA
jgi:hypothetical protein